LARYRFLTALLLGAILCATSALAADNNQQLLQQQISAFKQSDNYQFAPQTTQRAEAFMGAAMLAIDKHQQQDTDTALAKAAETLAEARRTAADFRRRFAAMLSLRQDAAAVTEILASSGRSTGSQPPRQLMKDAEDEFSQAVATYEQGSLNQARKHADAAAAIYRQALDQTLPWLTRLTASIIGKAANTNAKRYAPRIYQAAKDKLVELEAYSKGVTKTPPRHPEEGLYLARESRHVAEQVKAWRRKSSSHEMLVLKTRALKLKLANVLGISKQSNIMLTDIPDKDLLRAVKQLKQELADERQAHQQDMSRLATEFQQQLQHKLAAQTSQMQQAQQNRLSKIREAFKAKLERETFEKKRQQRLRKLFKPDEVTILVNLDGSLLIRLVSLKFRSGSSRVDRNYYDMLGRLKEAMDIYQERDFRIEGHTDNRGDVKKNQLLSLKRAEAVRDFLIAAGANAARLKALGYGEVRPIASNEFARGRAMNRRIDVVISAPKAAAQ